MEEQIITMLEQYAKGNPGSKVNEKVIDSIHQNATSFERFVSNCHYIMKTEVNDDNVCIVQFTTEQGAVMSTYQFFNVLIKAKK